MASWLALLALLQEPDPTSLKVGEAIVGVITIEAATVHSPTLDANYTSAPTVGIQYRLEVEQTGPHYIDLRSYTFDSYLILYDADGSRLAEDDDGLLGTHSRITTEKLEAGALYRVEVCALHGDRGGFEIEVHIGRPPVLAPRERASAELEDAKTRLSIVEGSEGPQSLAVATALDALGRQKEYQEDYEGALRSYQRALSIREKALGVEHLELVASLENLVVVYRQLSRLRESISTYERVLAIQESSLGSDHPQVAGSAYNLAVLCWEASRYPEAERLHRRALAIREQVLGPQHLEVGSSLNGLASLYHDLGRFDDAEPLYIRAMAVLEKALGPEHAHFVASIGNLATLYHDTARFAEAETLYKRALSIDEKVHGPDHPNVAVDLNNLASLYFDQGRIDATQPLYERALEIRERALGRQHPAVGSSLNNLAFLYATKGRVSDAEPMYERALRILEQALGSDHPRVSTTLDRLASLYMEQGRFGEAEPIYERALTIQEAVFGTEHPRVAATLDNLAMLYREQGHFDKAEHLHRRAMAIEEKAHGPEHPRLASNLNALAGLLCNQGRYDEAEPLWKRALAIQEKALSPEHPRVASSLHNLGVLYQNQGRYAEAETMIKRALAIQEQTLGLDHPRVALSLNNLAQLCEIQREYGAATPLRARAIMVTLEHLDRELPTMSEADRLRYLARAKGPGQMLANSLKLEARPGHQLLDSCLQWKGKATRLQAASIRLAQRKDDLAVRRRIDELQRLQRRLSSQLFLPPIQRAENHAEEVAELRQARLDLERTLNRELDLNRVLATPTSKEIQAALPIDSVVLDFHVGDEVFAWVLPSKGEPKLVALGDAIALQAAQNALLRSAVSRGGKRLGIEQDPGVELRELLWQPLREEIGEAVTVLVSPDGFLSELPLGILPSSDGGFLLERHRFVYLSDITRIVASDAAAAAREGSVLAVGDVNYFKADKFAIDQASHSPPHANSRSRLGGRWSSLKATREELQSIQDLHEYVLEWDSPFDRLDGKSASEEAVRQSIAGHRYIHLATHGYFEPDHLPSLMQDGIRKAERAVFDEQLKAVGLLPNLLTGLVFAGVNGEPEPGRDDGYLSAEEIQYLDLSSCDIAVLSACETALGSERAGEGLMSMRRAFEVAGAKTVVSSLWKVDDRATATLMKHFYENYWLEDMDKAVALHEAKLQMLRQNRADYGGEGRPETWGAFVLSGDWE